MLINFTATVTIQIDTTLATDGTLTIDLPVANTAKVGDKAIFTLVQGKTGVSIQCLMWNKSRDTINAVYRTILIPAR